MRNLVKSLVLAGGVALAAGAVATPAAAQVRLDLNFGAPYYYSPYYYGYGYYGYPHYYYRHHYYRHW